MELAALQHLFWRSVRHDPAPPEVDEAFVSRGDLSAHDRVAIYRRMYWYRQVDALFDTFPSLARGLGGERFTRLACAYITAHPSQHPALERLGRLLPDFARARGAELGVEPAWADVAAIEWARLRALLAPDPPAVAGPGDLAGAGFASASLELVPSMATARVSAAAVAVDRAVRDGEPFTLDGDRREVTLLAWRPSFVVRERVLDDDEATALALAERRAPLADICLSFAAGPTPEHRAAAVLHRWAGDRLIARVRTLRGLR